jgi:hypothetical protein
VIRTRQGAVRAPWRVLFFLAAVGAAFAVVQAIAYPLAAALLELAGLRVATYHVSLAAALLLAHWAALHWLDGRGWETVGLGRAAARPRRVAAGRAAVGGRVGGAFTPAARRQRDHGRQRRGPAEKSNHRKRHPRMDGSWYRRRATRPCNGCS